MVLRGEIFREFESAGERRPRPNAQFVVASRRMQQIVDDATRIADLDFPVLLVGESGVGKKRIGRLIHEASATPCGHFVHFPCISMQGTSPGAECVAWRRWVLSGAQAPAGIDDLPAGRCTVYLDDVGSLPLWAQIQLVETIEGGRRRSASRRVRFIASAIRSLDSGRLHQGLRDSLNIWPLAIPPLRERREDVRPLTLHFLHELCEEQGTDPRTFLSALSDETWRMVEGCSWPGNVRELACTVSHAQLLSDAEEFVRRLERRCRAPAIAPAEETISVPLANDLRAIQQSVVREVVRRYGGNKAEAARRLNLHRRTLYRLLEARLPRRRQGVGAGR